MVSSEYYVADNSNMEEKKLEAAKNHYKTGDYPAALKLYLSLLNTSLSYKLYYRIGKCYYKMGEFSSAKEYFEKSVSLESGSNPSYIYLGNINYKNEDLKKAIYYWACAFAYKPEDENISLNLATSYFSRGMKFQSVYYYDKYLKYANNKGDSYSTIKTSIDKCSQTGVEFLQKAKHAISRKDNITALEYLNFAYKNLPVSFDINYLLGSVYLAENDNMHALIYLKQAYAIDTKSLDVLQKLASTYINIGDYTSAYCTMRRLLPLVIHNQPEYLSTMKLIKELGASFDSKSSTGHKEWADRYFEDNNYHLALFEYENYIMLNEDSKEEYDERINQLKSFINPEAKVIKNSLEKGTASYKKGDFKSSNRFFTKVMILSDKESPEYKLAKSKVVNV